MLTLTHLKLFSIIFNMRKEEIKGIVLSVADEGFGFIEAEGFDNNIFFHADDCCGITIEQLREGDKVAIRRIIKTKKGDNAVCVKLIKE